MLFSLYLYSNTCFPVIFSVVICFVECLRALAVLFCLTKNMLYLHITYYSCGGSVWYGYCVFRCCNRFFDSLIRLSGVIGSPPILQENLSGRVLLT